MRAGLLALALTATLAAAGAEDSALPGGAEPAAWRFAHPDAQMVAGADLFRLGQSAAGEALRQRFLAAMGPELSRHVQRLLVTTTFLAGGETDTLVILSGPLDAARIKQMAARANAPIRAHRGIEVILPPGGTAADPHFAIVDAQTALIGTRTAVRGAIDRARAGQVPMAQVNPLYARAITMMAEAEVFVLADQLPAGLAPAAVERLAGLGGFDLALTLRPGARLAMELESADPAALATAWAEARRTPADPALLAAWADSLGAAPQPDGLLLGAALEDQELLERFPALAASLGLPIEPLSGPRTAARPPPPKAPAAPPTPPPAPLVVRIEGLEGGPVEIPYPAQQP